MSKKENEVAEKSPVPDDERMSENAAIEKNPSLEALEEMYSNFEQIARERSEYEGLRNSDEYQALERPQREALDTAAALNNAFHNALSLDSAFLAIALAFTWAKDAISGWLEEPETDGPESDDPDAEGPESEDPESEEPDAEGPEFEEPGADGSEFEDPDAEGPECEDSDSDSSDNDGEGSGSGDGGDGDGE